MSNASNFLVLFLSLQCEQTQDNKGCTTVGVCGKDAETASLQDLQLHFNIGLGQWAQAIESKGGKVSEDVKDLLLDSTFATLTNVNFDSSRFYSYLQRANDIRTKLSAQAKSLGVDVDSLKGPAQFQYNVRICTHESVRYFSMINSLHE